MENFKTLEEANKYLKDNLQEGVVCPCCNKFAKRYKRKLNSGMARTLLELYKTKSNDFIKVNDYLRHRRLRNNGDWTLLKFWSLIEEEPNPVNDGATRKAGYWKITDHGKRFAENRATVPEAFYSYGGAFLGYTGHDTSITKALGNKFNYEELMSS